MKLLRTGLSSLASPCGVPSLAMSRWAEGSPPRASIPSHIQVMSPGKCMKRLAELPDNTLQLRHRLPKQPEVASDSLLLILCSYHREGGGGEADSVEWAAHSRPLRQAWPYVRASQAQQGSGRLCAM